MNYANQLSSEVHSSQFKACVVLHLDVHYHGNGIYGHGRYILQSLIYNYMYTVYKCTGHATIVVKCLHNNLLHNIIEAPAPRAGLFWLAP